jgi:hypothetical protein
MNRLIEWLLIALILSVLVGMLTVFGIMLLPFAIVGATTLVIVWAYLKLSSLFPSSEARRRTREEDSDI